MTAAPLPASAAQATQTELRAEYQALTKEAATPVAPQLLTAPTPVVLRSAEYRGQVSGNAIIANGLAWSPDAATIYWTDTPSHTIRAWDWDAVSNTLSRPRVFASWPGKPAHWQPGLPDNGGYGGRPDGARHLGNCPRHFGLFLEG